MTDFAKFERQVIAEHHTATVERRLKAERETREALTRLRDAVEAVKIAFNPASPLGTAEMYNRLVRPAEARVTLAFGVWTRAEGR